MARQARQDRAIRTRKILVEAAATVFDQRGYEAATIGEIISTAGVTKGALYFHFASKEELAFAVLDAQLEDEPLPEQPLKLQQLIDSGMVLSHRLRHDPLVRASVRLTLDQGASGLDRRGPFLNWSAQNLQMLTAARDNGELLPHVVLEDTADMFVGAFAGIQAMSQTLADREDLGHRTAVLFSHVLPCITVPAVLASLDMSPDRGERLLAANRRDDAPLPELTEEPAAAPR
ncbi:ScbR family autoregulator-binding transcription factor [Streptomyces silvisoli]|uniref:ScbR family autoregulator-binding transcription factor n=1 Tax=Streptomyces silvisoli TaxID=3034235 RepID=A0ABT5ZP09_9ACTN|nr:ScbR family autoregulator-binding transcription factor [Streptomyces silvisoli]MDF3291396.1 ScbR family autoregulator-binding transcription factor [Streptomyces silvisoli]